VSLKGNVIFLHGRFLDQELCRFFDLTPKGPMSADGFLGSSGRLSRRQKHERSFVILKEGGPMEYL
jgi:hypothetical protein